MKPRLAFFDSLRGFAIVLMAVYHFCFDLRYMGLLAQDLTNNFWLSYRNLIVILFTSLAGIGFHLGSTSFRASSFRARLWKIFACALSMTAITYFLFPQSWIYFGILHFIFVASLFGPALVRIPRLCLLLGSSVAIAPLLWRSSLFTGSILGISGLSPVKPNTVDFVPLFPWLGVVMLGSAIGHFIRKKDSPFFRREISCLSFLGRHSLLFYMTHQMALLPAAWLLAQLGK